MAGSLDATKTVAAIISILQASLPAKLNVLDAAYADDLTLEDIQEYRRAPVQRHEAFPASVIACVSSPKPDDTRSYGIWVHNIQMLVILVGDQGTGAAGNPASLLPTEVLAIRAARTARGVVEVLEANVNLTVSGTNNADHLWVDDISYSEIMGPGDEDMFRKDALISLRVMVSV